MENVPILTDELLQTIIRSPSSAEVAVDGAYDNPSFADYLNAMLKKYGRKKSEVIRQSRVNETFAYQLFSGARKNPSRNKVLALALAMGTDMHDTRVLLSLADAGDLYVKNRRDAIIVFCISHTMGLDETDEELHRFGEETISDSGC